MFRSTRFFTSLVGLVCAAVAVTAAPAGAGSSSCPDGFEAYGLNVTLDTLVAFADLNRDGLVCVSRNGAVGRLLDNADASGASVGLPAGFIDVTGPVRINNVDITFDDIAVIDQDQRGNRNNGVGAIACSSQNTGRNSGCFGDSEILNDLVDVIVLDDLVLNLL